MESNFVPHDLMRGQVIDLTHVGPQFLITVDTEEAFDWSGPFTRDKHSVDHIPAVLEFQKICDRFGVKPIYMVDYPVIADTKAADLFRGLAGEGRALIGAHLHPWVTPPFDDSISRRNSYGCNLPESVERSKLLFMFDSMERTFGALPTIFRAGRYGIGANTAKVLAEVGVVFDSSVRSFFDYSAEGGPDFQVSSVHPYWIKPNVLAELPLTSVFVGPLRKFSPTLFGKDSNPAMMRGVFSRTGLLSRIAFTPEGVNVGEMKRGIDQALADGLPLLNLSFHSPSLVPGNTAYVRNEAERVAFLNWWREILSHLAERDVQPADLGALWAAIGPKV
jgi:hypothetical protein